ncbi:MAG: hypothetical protein ACO2Z1_04350 [Pontimonas sp.]
MSDHSDAAARWTLFGPVKRPAKPLWALLAISLLVAFETFIQRPDNYPSYMTLGVIAVATWLGYRALRDKVLIGGVGVLLAIPWVGQLVGTRWMDDSTVVFFLAHSLFAVYIAVAAYTFMAREGTS